MATITLNNHLTIKAEPESKEIFIEKEFNADCDLVFKAFTDPYLFAQWVGPKGFTTKIDRFEARNGGNYRFVQKDREGKEFAFHGVYHEILVPQRIINTMEFEGHPEKGHVELDTLNFESLPGSRTRLTIQSVFQSGKDRDAKVDSGLDKGMEEGFERLEDLLAKNLTSWDI